MELKNDLSPIWTHTLTLAEAITDDVRRERIDKASLISYLETLNEAFGDSRDPVEDFESYALLELCASIRRALEMIN